MQDHIVRAITKDGFLKATAICSTGIAERARQIHHTTPTATAALGRVLTAASMMGNMQKVENGTLTLQIKGGGPLGTLLAVQLPIVSVAFGSGGSLPERSTTFARMVLWLNEPLLVLT